MVDAAGDGAPAARTTVTFGGTTVNPVDTATTIINTYSKKYQHMPDVMSQSYSSLYSKADLTSDASPEALLEHALTTRNLLPKVFICLLEGKDKEPLMTILHRPFRYLPHPARASEWDNKTFCFIGDTMRGNNIITRELPSESFETTGSHKVPTLSEFDALLSKTDSFLPLPARTASTDELQTRYLVQIPHKYVSLAFNLHSRKVPPRTWWTELGGAITSDKKEKELSLLHDFLRLSCVRQSNDPSEDRDPGNMLGLKETIFPPLEIDDDINDYIQTILQEDFPTQQQQASPTSVADPALATVMREEYALNRAQRDRERRDQEAKEAAKKKPSYVFPLPADLQLDIVSTDNPNGSVTNSECAVYIFGSSD